MVPGDRCDYPPAMRASIAVAKCLTFGVLLAGCGSTVVAPPDLQSARATPSAVAAPRASSSAAPAQGAPAASRPVLEALRLALGASPGASAPGDVQARLQAIARTASAAERPLVDRMVALARRTQAIASAQTTSPDPDALRSIIDDLAQVLRDLGQLYPDDAAVGIQVAATLFTLPDMAASLRAADAARDDALRAEGRRLADEVVQRFPKEPRGFRLRGSLCRQTSVDMLPCIRDLATCKALDADAGCEEPYREAVREYEQPYCDQADVRGDFELRRALPGSPKGRAELLEDHHERFAIDDVGALGKRDIAGAHAAVRIDQSSIYDPALGRNVAEAERQVRTVTVRFVDARRDAIAAWTGEIARAKGRLVVQSGGKRLLAARVMGAISGSLSIAEVPIEAVCAKVKGRTLPGDLPRP